MADEIDYKLVGDDMQMVVITLDPGEGVIAEAGAMTFMTDGIEMNTSLSVGKNDGLFGKLLGAGKRLLTGESFFITIFACRGPGRHKVGFAAPFPGKIIPVDLEEHDGQLLCQKDAFLCAAKGVNIDIAFQKKLGTGFFGGEGFILQKLTGEGLAFIHAGGTVAPFHLEAGQTLRVDTGCLVAFESTIDYDIEFVGGIKTALFGGEGLFFARLAGPGTAWLQTLPFSRLADRVISAAPRAGGTQRGEGSVLGSLGNLIDGDNQF